MKKVAIVGAGLAGCLLASYLAKRGYTVELYERRPDPRSGKVDRGRSINLALSERGLDALRRIGLDQLVMKDALPMTGRMIHPVAGELDFQPYSHDADRAINSISRAALNAALLDAALSASRPTLGVPNGAAGRGERAAQGCAPGQTGGAPEQTGGVAGSVAGQSGAPGQGGAAGNGGGTGQTSVSAHGEAVGVEAGQGGASGQSGAEQSGAGHGGDGHGGAVKRGLVTGASPASVAKRAKAGARNAINAAINGTGKAAVTAYFEKRLVGLDPVTNEMRFEDGTKARADIIIGADGAGSAVRGQLLGHGLLTESLDFLDYGYKELSIPPRKGDWALDPGALHIWPRGKSMMIALPNPDKSFTCTLFWPNGGTSSFASLTSPAAIARHFQTHYPDVPAIAPTLVDDYQHNPIGLLGTVRCTPWVVNGRIALIGDAAHAIVPFYGQGANCAFEDVVELDRCLAETGDDWARALSLFQERRQANAEAIAQMALANFVEMRDKVASPIFQAQKKLEHVLERALPGRYVSRYELVSFSTTPYSQVQRRVRRQRRVLGAVVGGAVLGLAALATRLIRSK